VTRLGAVIGVRLRAFIGVRLDLARRSDAGVSLIELIVVMSLLAVVLPTAFTAVSSMQKSEATTTDRFAALSEAQIIANRITKDLRAAVSPNPTGSAFILADAREVTFYASLAHPAGPIRLHAYVANLPGTSVAAFHEDQLPADTGSAPNYTYAGTEEPRINGKYVDTTSAIFSYYDKKGVVLATPVTTLSALRSIETIKIKLTTRVTPTAPATTIETSVLIRNVDYNPS
jgi:prepilin-type N-terminal cleavage/methylation domain-containing protein